jgi:PAS domain S-box-containing protein
MRKEGPEGEGVQGRQPDLAPPTRELHFRRLLEKLPAAAYTCDPEGLITYFNEYAVRLWGRAPKLNDPVDRYCGSFKLFSTDGSPLTHDQSWMALAIQGGKEYNQEILIERPDGQRLTAMAHASPVIDESGRLLGGVNILVDITDRKRADESQALLAAIVESSDDAIISKTLEGRILSWNAGAERLFGYTAPEAIGQPISLIIPPEMLDEEGMILERLRGGERVEHFETVRMSKEGRRLDISLTISPVRDSAGRVVAASKVARDITARKQLEAALAGVKGEQLRQSEERFRVMVEGVRDYAIFMLDPEGHVVSWNAGAERIKGYRAAEILGQHFSKFYTRDDIEGGKPEHELLVAAAEGRLEDEGWRVRKDGTTFWANVVITALRDQIGSLRGFAKVTRDITERKQAEELRARLTTQVLAAQDDERRRVARELHDETGQSLTGLLVGLRTIEGAPTLAEAAELAQQLRGIVAQSLGNVRRLARGLHPRVLDDLGFAAAVTGQVQEFAELHGIAVDARVKVPDADRLPPLLQTTLYRVLQEALTNVARHAEARHVRVRLGREAATLTLCVQDDGIGMTPQVALGPLGAGNHRGRGLEGMRERVALLGGSVHVESEPGVGTTITARIPVPANPRRRVRGRRVDRLA